MIDFAVLAALAGAGAVLAVPVARLVRRRAEQEAAEHAERVKKMRLERAWLRQRIRAERDGDGWRG